MEEIDSTWKTAKDTVCFLTSVLKLQDNGLVYIQAKPYALSSHLLEYLSVWSASWFADPILWHYIEPLDTSSPESMVMFLVFLK